ncbi:hypothetical protein ACFE04_001134 [Oxalis oulophora]
MGLGLGRGSAMLVVMCMVMVMSHCELANAATYTVGGTAGWTFNVANWPKGKHFKAGDTLVFQYNPQFHNVVAVNKGGYDGCSTPKGTKVYTSGNDNIKLVKGQNYFICNVVGHCQSGMKISVHAL